MDGKYERNQSYLHCYRVNKLHPFQKVNKLDHVYDILVKVITDVEQHAQNADWLILVHGVKLFQVTAM